MLGMYMCIIVKLPARNARLLSSHTVTLEELVPCA